MNSPVRKVILVGSTPSMADRLGRALRPAGGEGPELATAADWGHAQYMLGAQEFMALFLDLNHLGADGLEPLSEALAGRPDLPVLALTGAARNELACLALMQGAQEALGDDELEPARLQAAMERAALRQRSLAALRNSEARHRSIVESQTEIICRFLPDGTLTFTNQAFRNYFRWAREGSASRKNLFANQDEQELKQTLAQLRALTPEHPLARVEKPFKTKKGEQRWQRWTNRAIFDAQGRVVEYQSVGHDVTERKHMEQALQMVEANLRALFLSSADGMIVVDEQGQVQFANPAAERMLGRRASELARRHFEFALTPGQRQEVHLVGGQGEDLVAEMQVVATKWQDRPAFLATLRDITELARLREELRSLSLVDEMTGLFNRRGFVTLAEQQVKTAQRMHRHMRLFFMDLDDLKIINDNLGHREGDRALLAAAQVIKGTFRESDILARVGGDEFVALTMEGEEDSTEALCQRLNENAQAFQAREKPLYRLSLSVGAEPYNPDAPVTLDELMYAADVKMYQNKRRKQSAR